MINAFKIAPLLVVWFLPTYAEARCTIPFIRAFENQTAQGTMFADSGKQCSMARLASAGPMDSVRIVSGASHGTVSAGSHSVNYISKTGYSGEDHFAFADIGRDTMNRPTTKTIEVTVVVSAANSPSKTDSRH